MSAANEKATQPMDPGAPEGTSPSVVKRNVRNAYALDQLVEEVHAAFGEVPVIYGYPDQWQVIHEVAFEADDNSTLADVMLDMSRQDERITRTDAYDGHVWVLFQRNRRIRDTRDGFGVGAVLEVHREDEAEPVVHKVAQARQAPVKKARAPRKTAAKKAAPK